MGNWSVSQKAEKGTASHTDDHLFMYGTPVMFPGGETLVPQDTHLDMSNITLRVVTIMVSPVSDTGPIPCHLGDPSNWKMDDEVR